MFQKIEESLQHSYYIDLRLSPTEGVVKSRLAPPGCVEKVLECSFTTCKLRFCAHFRLARKHNPTFYDTLHSVGQSTI
ncbi:MAG: hypothetical protein IZT55_02205 [Anaerolineae bacterium]|nr:hypothetical protein [Anaerolineae bacterium]